MPETHDTTALQAAIGQFVEPNLRQSLAEAKAIRSLERHGQGWRVTLALGLPVEGYAASLQAALQQHLAAHGMTEPVVVTLLMTASKVCGRLTSSQVRKRRLARVVTAKASLLK